MAQRADQAVVRPDDVREAAALLEGRGVLERPLLQHGLARLPLARHNVGVRDLGEGRGRVAVGVHPERPVCDVHAVVRVERHEDVVDLERVAFDQLGVIQERMGNRSENNAPRNTYETRDSKWVAISTNSPAIVRRVLTLCGGEEAANDQRFQTPQGRVEHIDEVDGMVADWIKQRDQKEVLEKFEEAEAAIGPAYDVAQIFEDPQYHARGDIIELDDEDLGKIRMTAAFPFMSETPAEIRHAGPRKGQHNAEILCGELGVDAADLAKLSDEGVI